MKKFAALLSLMLVGSLVSAARATAIPVFTPPLTVEASALGDGTATLTVDTLDDEEGLPTFTPVLSRVTTGQRVQLTNIDDYSEPFSADTASALVNGASYEFTLRVQTTGHWSCSVYDPNGCSWQDDATNTYRWRFIWHSAGATASKSYYPAPTLKAARSKKGAHAWKITGTLKQNGKAWKGAKIQFQRLEYGYWTTVKSARTLASGKAAFTITVKKTPGTKLGKRWYRLYIEEGATTRKAATAKFHLLLR